MVTGARRLAVAAASALILGPPAGASVQVIGAGPEKQCYDAARARRATGAAFEFCKMALANIVLPDDDRAATYVNRSVLHLVRNKPDAALSDVTAALAVQPGLAAAFINRSSALYMLRRYEEAKAAVDTALPLASGDEVPLALFNRAMASEALGDLPSAYDDLKRAVALAPAFAEAQTELARYQVTR